MSGALASGPVTAVRGERLASVDVFRGITMAAMVIVNTPGDWGTVYWPLLHAEWHGWTPTDLIFPFFVFILGVSITLSRRRAAGAGVIARRAVILYGLGLLLALYPRFDFASVRLVGVLARLAFCYLAAALYYRTIADLPAWERRHKALMAAGWLLVGYWVLLRFVPAPGGVAGDLSPSGNLGAWIDRTVLGEAHLWSQSRTWDPEGLLSTLPAIATALTGVAAGAVLTSPQSATTRLRLLFIGGAVATLLGLVWGLGFPINKNLWTSSYVLFTSGLAAMALAVLHRSIDLSERPARWTYPLVVMGTNALTLFVVSGWLVKTLIMIHVPGPDGSDTTLYRAIYETMFVPLASPKLASLMFALAALGVLYLLLEVMYRRRWFLRA
jgi:predicted acyltransferase